MELISIGKFAKMISAIPTTLRRMQETGKLFLCHISKGGTRYYSTDQLKQFSSIEERNNKKVVGYCRVSTPS